MVLLLLSTAAALLFSEPIYYIQCHSNERYCENKSQFLLLVIFENLKLLNSTTNNWWYQTKVEAVEKGFVVFNPLPG